MASHLDNIPAELIPIGASPNDIPIGRDELGRVQYRGITGTRYWIDPSWRQKPTERSVENIPKNIQTAGRIAGAVAGQARTAVREWLRDPSLPSGQAVVSGVKAGVDAATESGRRLLEGEATYLEAMNVAGAGVGPRPLVSRPNKETPSLTVEEELLEDIIDEDDNLDIPEDFNFAPESEPLPPVNPVIPEPPKPVMTTTVRNTPAVVLKVQENSFNPRYNPTYGESLTDVPSGRVDFYNPIINSLQDLNFDKRPLTGREISKFIETKAIGYRGAISRSMDSGRGLFNPEQRYTREEAMKILQDNENRFYSIQAGNNYEAFQRLPSGDSFKEVSYSEYVLKADPDSFGRSIKPITTHAIDSDDELIHMRTSQRETPEGRVFVVEEIQSDAFHGGVITPIPVQKATENLELYKTQIDSITNSLAPHVVKRYSEEINRVKEFKDWLTLDNVENGFIRNSYIKFLMETRSLGRREASKIFEEDEGLLNIADNLGKHFDELDFTSNTKLLPIESVTDYVRPMINTAIVEAKRNGIDRVFLPDSTTILEARAGQGLAPEKARAIYDDATRKVLGELYREQGVEIKVTPVNMMTGSGKRISFETEMPNAARVYNTMDNIIEKWTTNNISLTTEQIDKIYKAQDELIDEIKMPDLSMMTFQEALEDGYEATDLVRKRLVEYNQLIREAVGDEIFFDNVHLPIQETGGAGPAPISGYMLELGNIPTDRRVRFAKGGLVKSEFKKGILRPFALDKNEWLDDNDEVHVLDDPEDIKEAYREYYAGGYVNGN